MIKLAQMRHSKIITLRIPKELDDLLAEVCSELGYKSKSEFVREAVDEYINYLFSLIKNDEDLIDTEEELFESSKVIMI
ncbi:MAG: ribbon-helix-helix domain-containing protein [Sulfolobales archaeon]